MDCTPFREALSARLDGEELGLPVGALEAHLSRCADCAGWARAAAEVTRRVQQVPAPAVPDLTAAVLGRLPQARPARSGRWAVVLRVVLVLVGSAQAALAWPSLAHGVDAMSAPVHMAHETGAWNFALAVAFLAVAAAPRLAPGALPLLGTFSGLLTVVTVDDLAAGRVDAGRAFGHLLLLTGLVLVATVAWRGRRRTGPGAPVPGLGVPA